jgi:hypothetical protein
MDLSLWAMLVQAAVFVTMSALGDRRPSAWHAVAQVCLAVAMVLTRPEAMFLVPALSVFAVITSASSLGAKEAMRRQRAFLLACVAALSALTVFRESYFGYPLPNTYYAKVSSDPLHVVLAGLGYLKWFLTARPWQLVALLLAAVLAFRIRHVPGALIRHQSLPEADRLDSWLLLVIALGVVLPVVVGGDAFGAFRFYQPYVLTFGLPVVALAGRAGKHAVWAAKHRVVAAMLCLGLVGGAWWWFGRTHVLFGEFLAARSGRAAGAVLNEAFAGSEPPRVGVIAAGGVARTYCGRVLDLLGLNWAKMAHAQGKPTSSVRVGHDAFTEAVFWADPPEVVAISFNQEDEALDDEASLRPEFATRVLRGLPISERFRAVYQPVVLRPESGALGVYVRRDWLRGRQFPFTVLLYESESPTPE